MLKDAADQLQQIAQIMKTMPMMGNMGGDGGQIEISGKESVRVSGGFALMREESPAPQAWMRGSGVTWNWFSAICGQPGLAVDTLSGWVRSYRERGEAGLHPKPMPGRPGRKQCPEAVKAKIVELKRKDPDSGIKRISQTLRQWFHLSASPETVRVTLHEQGLIEPKPVRAPKAPPKPRFFERSTPNQLWQSDIFTFRLGGKNAYLIGYIDDYSRYLVGLGLYRSQTAEHVLETYRRAVGEYGVPREMLTDNGRQYTNWRGKTRFEQELAKDKVHHLRSRPHHPMTLGKIERFWQNIHGEFLCRAQFDSFEQAQERVRLWVKQP
jgi:transposase InsO family protein